MKFTFYPWALSETEIGFIVSQDVHGKSVLYHAHSEGYL